MIETIVGLLSSSGLGAIIGTAGAWITKREERMGLTLKLQHDRAMAELRNAEAQMEFNHELAVADKNIERSRVEGEVAESLGELEAFTASLKEQTHQYSSSFVDTVRGLMRPTITIYVLVIASLLAWDINNLVGGLDSIPQAEILAMYRDIIAQLLFLATTAVTWWFGSRPTSQREVK